MKSKNKPAMTRKESEHVERVAELPCIVCDSTEYETTVKKYSNPGKIGAVHKACRPYAPLPTPLS